MDSIFFLQTPYKIWYNNENIMTEMSKKEIKRFLMQGTLTGKLATAKKDGSPHVVPIWFTVDDNDSDNGDIVLPLTVHQSKQKIFNVIIE
jgi:nitroimidazol reductase NimA-like FMN-containing flavoprotein (pyridoxamine 5'-phosphate oxidase superfamily)